MDEENNELNEGQGRQKSSGGGFRNPGTATAEKLKDAQKTMEQGSKLAGKASEKLSGKKSGELAKKLSAKLGKASTQAGKAAKVAAKLGKYIATVGWFILIIIAIIGLLVFILTGMGLILQGLKDVATTFFNSLYNYMYGEQDNISDEEILDTMTYLDEMGYDLYGFGFVSETAANRFYNDNSKTSTSEKVAEEVSKKSAEENRELTEEEIKQIQDDVTAPSSNDPTDRLVTNYDFTNFFKNMFDVSNTVEQDHYRNILAYLYSDKYAYLIKNKNVKHNAFTQDLEGIGLIDLYWENGIGQKSEMRPIDSTLPGIKVDTDRKTLTMESVSLGANKINYSLEGWTGRYSMPLEFLLATHLATMAPDLSYKLAKTYTGNTDDNISTEVEILLHNTEHDKDKENNINAAVIPPGKSDSDRIEKSKLSEINDSFGSSWDWLDNWQLSAEDCLKILQTTELESMPHDYENDRYKCVAPMDSEVYSQYVIIPLGTELEEEKDNQVLYYIQNIIDKCKENSEIEIDDIDNLKTDVEDFFWSTTQSQGQETAEIVNVKNEDKCGDTNNYFEKNGTYDGNDVIFRLNVKPSTRDQNSARNWNIVLGYHNVNEDIVCSDTANAATEACENCKNFVTDIYKALNEIKANNLQTYVPYIYQVKDHWFRDVYFTKQAAIDAGNSVIQTDDEYEKKTGERWTLYELDPYGKYELYVYKKKKDGNYAKNFLKTGEDGDKKYVVCKKVESGGSYKLSDDGTTYVKQVNGPYKLMILEDADAENEDKQYTDYTGDDIEEFRVGKKAETTTIDDLNWEGAYSDTVDTSSGTWEDVETNEESPDAIKSLKDTGIKFQYQMNMGKINQVADAVRGETNPKIKQLFLDDYYKYDGSRETAKVIDLFKSNLRIAVENKGLENVDIDDPDNYKKYIEDDSLIYEGKKVYLDTISGPISLTHDALSAFSILKNMHTLDAEYIYHDFKELIVELNYFDKEDLVEPEDEVLMFPIAGVSAAGWPVTEYDKSEEFYGTLIYSAEDLEAKRAEEELELLEKFGIDTEDDFTSENTEQSKSEYESQGGDADYTSSDGSVKITNGPGGAYGADRLVTVNGVTYQQFFQTEAHHNTWELPRADEGPDDPARLEIGCGFCSATSVASAYVSDMDLEVMLKKLKELNLEWSNSAREQKVKKLLNSYGIKGEWQAGASGSKLKEIIEKAFEEGKPVIIRQGANSTAPWKTGRTLSCISWN